MFVYCKTQPPAMVKPQVNLYYQKYKILWIQGYVYFITFAYGKTRTHYLGRQ